MLTSRFRSLDAVLILRAWALAGSTLAAGCSHDFGFLKSSHTAMGSDAGGETATDDADARSTADAAAEADVATDTTGITDTIPWQPRLAIGRGHYCVVRGAARAVSCAGPNDAGQLGNGQITDPGAPVSWSLRSVAIGPPPEILSGVTGISAGPGHTCALRSRTILCWGDDTHSESGGAVGTLIDRATPVVLPAPTPNVISEVASGYGGTCIRTDRGVICWGANEAGQRSSAPVSEVRPTVNPALSGLANLSFASKTAYGLDHDGGIRCWGDASSALCGEAPPSSPCSQDPAATCVMNPAVVGPLPPSIEITAGAHHACAIDGRGNVTCWGFDVYGQVGTGPRRSCNGGSGFLSDCVRGFWQVAIDGAEKLALTSTASCALRGGRVYCWGFALMTGRGLGTDRPPVDKPLPVQKEDGTDLTDVVEVRSSEDWTCALDMFDAVYCWGRPVAQGGHDLPEYGFAHEMSR